jgi:hypothetical protein
MENKNAWKPAESAGSDLYVHDNFHIVHFDGWSPKAGDIPKLGASMNLWPHPRPLILRMAPHWGFNLHIQSCRELDTIFVSRVVQRWRHILLRATLDKGPMSRDQWIQTILLVKSFKLVPRPVDEGPRPKSGKLRLNLHGTCFGGKINWFGRKNSAKRRAPDLKNQESV